MSNYSRIEWIGENSHYVSPPEEYTFVLQKDHIKYLMTVYYFATK